MLPWSCKDDVVECAANSTCGRPGAVTCCRVDGRGHVSCTIKSSADKCLMEAKGNDDEQGDDEGDHGHHDRSFVFGDHGFDNRGGEDDDHRGGKQLVCIGASTSCCDACNENSCQATTTTATTSTTTTSTTLPYGSASRAFSTPVTGLLD